VTVIRIVGQTEPERAWLHRFRNFGEAVSVALRDHYAVRIDEIDAAIDTFHIRDIPPERVAEVSGTLTRMLREHDLEQSVFLLPLDVEHDALMVVLVVDPAYGDRLWEIAARHDAWVVPGDSNKAVVEEMWAAKTAGDDMIASVTIWSVPMPAVTEEDWVGMLDTIEVHHGDLSSEPPMDTLSVYGAAVTPAITAALRECEYTSVKATKFGFLAFKGHATVS
jgi:hypothetical protein